MANVLAREADTPRGHGLIIHAVSKGLLDLDQDVADILYRCCQCGLCLENCVYRYDHPELVRLSRVDAVERGLAPPEAMAAAERIRRCGNPFGLDAAARASLRMGLPLVSWDEPCATPDPAAPEVILWPGSVAEFLHPEVLKAAVGVLQAAGVSYALLPGRGTCGHLLHALGFEEGFHEVAAEVRRLVSRAAGILPPAVQLVALEAACARAFVQVYPREGHPLPLPVATMAAFLNHLAAAGRLRLGPPPVRRLVYHDPPELARGLRELDAPRQLLQRLPGVQLLELFHHGPQAPPTGGLAAHLTHPGLVAELSRRILAEAQQLGAQAVVTGTVECKHDLMTVASEFPQLRVLELTELIASALDGEHV